MHLAELKAKSPADLLSFAESLQVENASSLRKQDMMFAILKNLAENDQAIHGDGTLEILPDGFGFLRSPQSNYLPGPDDIYVSPNQVRRYGLRTGDTVEGQIRAPKDGERYFALLKVDKVNFENPGSRQAPYQFRQSDAALSRPPPENGNGEFPERRERPAKGFHPARHRPGSADRHGPARPDRRPAAHRQNRDAAKHRHRHFQQPPRSLPHRAAHRRAARGSHRHGPHRERRSRRQHLRRAGHPPRASHRNGAGKSQAPGGAQARRGHPAGQHHAPRPRLQHRRAVIRQSADRRRGRQRPANARNASSAPRATSRKAAR